MNKSTKSVLLSALVFPGAGQLYLKKYRMASALIVTTLACLYIIIMDAVEQAMKIVEELQASSAAINANNIVEMSTRAANEADTTTSSIATMFIVACWVISIIHAYRSGKQSDT